MAGKDFNYQLDEILDDKSRERLCELDDQFCIQIPRCLYLDDYIISRSLQTFTDASREAYGSVICQTRVYEWNIIYEIKITESTSCSINFSQHSTT